MTSEQQANQQNKSFIGQTKLTTTLNLFPFKMKGSLANSRHLFKAEGPPSALPSLSDGQDTLMTPAAEAWVGATGHAAVLSEYSFSTPTQNEFFRSPPSQLTKLSETHTECSISPHNSLFILACFTNIKFKSISR